VISFFFLHYFFFEASREEAALNLANSEAAFANFQKTAKRRQMMKKKMEDDIERFTSDLVKELREIEGEEKVDDQGTVQKSFFSFLYEILFVFSR
jgi:hypothetical protein